MANNKVTAVFKPDDAELGRQVSDILQARMRSILRLIAADARVNVPVKTGNLGRSIKEGPVITEGPFKVTGSVSADAPYAAFVHQGTQPHVIRPRTKKALRFTMDGREVFAKSVNHPGTRPRPFLLNAAERVLRDLK